MRVFSGFDLTVLNRVSVLKSFFAYGPNFTGGVNVAAGDVNGDGKADIITGTGPGSSPLVNVFDGVTGHSIASFIAFPGDTRSGVNVASIAPLISQPGTVD